MPGNALAWRESVTIPTYAVGAVSIHPMFLSDRVYQGSSGQVYPYGVIGQVSDNKADQTYQAIFLENDFIKIMLLPELGGRIHRAFDKIRGRDFVYYNEVIKPALVGLTGPWISGGIEFNVPQHHRPTTFAPVDADIQHHRDGSVTVWLGELELMHQLLVEAGFRLYPDRALLEVTGKVFNGNQTPRSFLWWSNPAVSAGMDHQTIFPQDVTTVYDHGKRDLSSFPVATGEYYKVDYSPGTDISRYKNIPVPTSYMAASSGYDFVGAYSHNEKAGLLHLANHHLVPGKKQWTWGAGEFGQAWDRQLTEANGPYIELMTGAYTDNQPDFTWLDPNEEKIFTQYFLPYSELATVHNANTHAAIMLTSADGLVEWGVYAITYLSKWQLGITGGDNRIIKKTVNLDPGQSLHSSIRYLENVPLTITLSSPDAVVSLNYTYYPEHKNSPENITSEPSTEDSLEPAQEPPAPVECASIDELFFIGQHLQQYHHARVSPLLYYREALRRDPCDYRCNLALAQFEFDRCNYRDALTFANHALERAHRFNKNPDCGRASFIRGAIQEKRNALPEAYADFMKSCWSGNYQAAGLLGAARVANKLGHLHDALSWVERALVVNGSSYSAALLKAIVLNKLNRTDCALDEIKQGLKHHPLGYGLCFLRATMTRETKDEEALFALANGRDANAIMLAALLYEMGEPGLASRAISMIKPAGLLPKFLQHYLSWGINNNSGVKSEAEQTRLTCNFTNHVTKGFEQDFAKSVLFPNTSFEVEALQSIDHYFARYLLGCFFYAKGLEESAYELWQQALGEEPHFAPVCRCLAIYQFHQCQDKENAFHLMERAFSYEPKDAQLLFELDQLAKRLEHPLTVRLERLDQYSELVFQRDDLTLELINIWNISGDLDKAQQILATRNFHPWEGGEGQVTTQFLLNSMRRALLDIQQGEYSKAIKTLNLALNYPDNLGEGRLPGQGDSDIYYLMGLCHELKGAHEEATACFCKARQGQPPTLNAALYYNDQPVDYLLYQGLALSKTGGDPARFFKEMIEWAKAHQADDISPDFFAVSLPNLQVFPEDPGSAHQAHCYYVQALGYLGSAITQQESLDQFHQIIRVLLDGNPSHGRGSFLLEVSRLL